MSYKYSRKDYMNKKVSHNEYYAQFITPSLVMLVKSHVGEERIMKSKDEHFNDIHIWVWDKAAEMMNRSLYSELAESNASTTANNIPSISLSDKVCLLKAAARQIAGR